MNSKHYIASDFGAGSGRVIAGFLSGGILTLNEVHRFPNRMVHMGDQLCWDFPFLLYELKLGLKKAVEQFGEIESIGVDTWGVDFGLIDEQGHLIGNPVCYRDGRTKGVSEKVFKSIQKEYVYYIAGTQMMEINTIYQLAVMQMNNDPKLNIARHLLFMPDLFNYFLTGEKRNEYTIASTSSLLDAKRKSWAYELIDKMSLPPHLFCEIAKPGSFIGTLTKSVCEELNCKPCKVIAVGSHDTASAAAVTFKKDRGTAFLSSGTWSLLGMFIDEPILNKEALEQDITNEGGLYEKILFLKNITGLWLFENLVKEFQTNDTNLSYDILLDEAKNSDGNNCLLDPDDPIFNQPASMREAIETFCKRHNQTVPVKRGEFVRVVLNSLSQKYNSAVADIEKCTTEKINQIHIVGGGSKNELLCRLTANATGLKVIAGPVESTAIGNILVQAIAAGDIKDLDEAFQILERSFDVKYYYPK